MVIKLKMVAMKLKVWLETRTLEKTSESDLIIFTTLNKRPANIIMLNIMLN